MGSNNNNQANRRGILEYLSTAGRTIANLKEKESENPDKAVFVGQNAVILNDMQKDILVLNECITDENTVGVADTLKNVQNKYPVFFDALQLKLRESQPGTHEYKTSLETLATCGAMLTATQLYTNARIESNVFPNEGLVAGDATESLKNTLSAFREAFNAFPESSSSALFTDVKDSLDKVIRGEGTLKDVYDKVNNYRTERAGLIFSPFTSVGKHRLFVADKLSEFISKFNIVTMDKELEQKAANAKAEKQANEKYVSMNDKVYELIREKCKQLRDNGVVPKGTAGDIAIIAYNASYEQKEYLLNKFLNDDDKVKALLADHPESKDFQKALDTILGNVNKNEFNLLDKQNEYYSLDNQPEMEQNEYNLLEPENEFNLLDSQNEQANNEVQQAEKSDYNLM